MSVLAIILKNMTSKIWAIEEKNQQVGLHQSKTSEQEKKLLTKWKFNLQNGWKYFQIRYRIKG